MPNLPISGLPSGSTLTGTESFAMVQDGVTKQTSLNTLYTSLSSNYGLFNQTGSSAPISGSTHISGSLINGGVGTLSVPANGFTKGDAYEVVMAGYINCDNGTTLDIHVDAGSVRLADTDPITMAGASNQNWRLIINFSINKIGGAGTAEIQTVGTFQYRKDASDSLVSEIFEFTNNTTFDTTISNTLDVRANWGNSPTDADSIYSKLFTLKKTY